MASWERRNVRRPSLEQRPRGEAAGKHPIGSDWSLPPHTSSFTNPDFGLIYLDQEERNLSNLFKKIEIAIHIPNLLELIF